MTDRARTLRRIAELQRQMYRIEEWRLIHARARETQLRDAATAVIEALNDDAALQGLFLPEMARRLGRLDAERGQVQAEETRLKAAALDRARRREVAETMLKTAEREAEAARRKAEFDEILEQDVARRHGASFP